MNLDDLRRRAQQALTDFVKHTAKAPPWENRKIVVYGAGGFGRDLAKALLLKPKSGLLGFLDQKGAGQKVLDDLTSHPLESATAKKWLAEKPVVIIGVYNPAVSLREIKAQLTRFGFTDIITPMEAHPYLSKELGWRFWLGTAKHYADALQAVEEASTIWSDQESQQLYLETLLFRTGFDLEMCSSPTTVNYQYADSTLPRWPEPLRIVDGGAYTGDTLQRLTEHNYRFAAIYGFEPDGENFKKLRTTTSTFPAETQISLWPCGVGAATGRLRFSEGEGTSSKFSEKGTSELPVVALDDVLQGQPVNLIKLDIEGAEADALRGARGLIEKYRPGLAVCLYHYPHHLWSIPLWVRELNLGYRFHCRAYAHNTFETVLYAIPG
jgi:FkbM family methyltransferase